MKNLRELSLRIKNIRSVQKTTKIMQMVSAVKLSESKKKLSSSKLYISKLYSIISSLMLLIDQELLARVLGSTDHHQDSSSLVFIIASDRGLCGNFNASIVRFSQEHINQLIINSRGVDIIFFGKKAFFDIGKNSFGSQNILRIESSRGVMLNHIESLINSIDLVRYSKVEIYYNKFYNTFIHKPTLEIIKPWSKNSSLIDHSISSAVVDCVYEYEPQNIEFILRFLIKNYVISAIYSALLESAASENGARMVAMELANKNTKDMLDKLLFLYNRSRQSAITTGLIEIICGIESL